MNPSLRRQLNMEPEIEPKVFPAPLFLLGCMRSGTTFLVDKLTQHPQLLKIGSELNAIWTAIGHASCQGYCVYKDESDLSAEAVANMTFYFTRFMTEAPKFRRHLMRAKNVYREGRGAIFYDWKKVIPTNKSPHLTNKIRYVHALFPKSKLVFIVRDIFGQSSSMKVHFDRDYESRQIVNYIPKDPKGCYSRFPEEETPGDVFLERKYPGDFSIIPEMWIRLNALALKDIQQLPEGTCHVIVYEDLVMQQEKVMNRLFEFLELDPDHRDKEAKIASEKLELINTTTKGNPLEKWRKLLSDEEIAAVEGMKDTWSEAYRFIENELAKYRS